MSEPTWADLVLAELGRAAQHPPYASAHEAYAVLLEEVEEFWQEVRKKRQHRDRGNMLKELVQIAAVAQKAAYSLDLLPHAQEGASSR